MVRGLMWEVFALFRAIFRVAWPRKTRERKGCITVDDKWQQQGSSILWTQPDGEVWKCTPDVDPFWHKVKGENDGPFTRG